MAIFHCSIKIFSRSKGKSAVAAAAYRSGEKITNEYDGEVHDYTRKGGVVHTEILLSENAPAEYADRSILWNAVEKSERYKTAQLAREIEIALPVELTREQNILLVRKYVKENFVSAGMCADICVHDKGDGNPHAHIMLTMRAIEKDGKWCAKSRNVDGRKINTVDWNDRDKAEEWRKAWADYANAALRQNGKLTDKNVLDHRSYERQGIEQIPTIHLGVAASQMERKGIRTERGNINREIEVNNKLLRQLRARLNHLNDWLKDEIANPAPPTIQDVFERILHGENRNHWQHLADLKNASKILIFLQDNDITEVAQLGEKMKKIIGQTFVIGDKIKPVERRIKTLNEHINQAEIYNKHKAIYKKYNSIKPKNQADFYENNRAAITLYEAAKKYLDNNLNGHTLPLKSWKAEREELTAELAQLSREYRKLKEEVKEVETIRRGVESVVGKEQKTRKMEMGL
ncbi:hypothetical protein AGMMS49975_22380 [Clostridia bacterium]|nr:hypothetical protein AGMMS49975_22380 [Clostridia bacterium]